MLTELPDELLVYDPERHRAHCLNPSAALVFKHGDGETGAEEMARLLQDLVHLRRIRDLRRRLLRAP